MSTRQEETSIVNQLGAYGRRRETAIGTPQQWAPVTAQGVIRSGEKHGASSTSCSTYAQATSQHVTFEQIRTAEKGLTVGPGRQNGSPRSQSQSRIGSMSTSLERLTLARRAANRESVNRETTGGATTHLQMAYDSSRDSINESRHSSSQTVRPEASHPGKILISSTREPISYIYQAKRFLSEHGEVHLSALGVAIGPMVTLAEILKSRQLAVVTKLHTSLEHATTNERCSRKPKMDIILGKAVDFDAILEAEATERQKAPDTFIAA